MAQLRDAHRARQIAQRVAAEIGQPCIVGELVFDQFLGGAG